MIIIICNIESQVQDLINQIEEIPFIIPEEINSLSLLINNTLEEIDCIVTDLMNGDPVIPIYAASINGRELIPFVWQTDYG
ncbi:MAG: hypothetical protein M0P71_11940 [Melioribacteraceae bacterium]|jgi:hypothetical protein|nr:hypothetical protein [Melioribacteraceae bacterium]